MPPRRRRLGACSSPETVGVLTDGSHTFEVRATDAASNVDPTPASHTWTVDTVAPDSSFSDVPADPSNDTTPAFEFSANEAGSTFECRLDSGSRASCASPATLGPLADGAHTFDVRATDAAGNQETAPASHGWVVDVGAPGVTITQPAGFVNASDADPYTISATSPDGDVANVEFFRCSDDSTGCSTGTWVSLGTDTTAPFEASWPLDADGNRALRAVATDSAANTGSHVVDITIDRVVPATSIDSAPADPSADASASFEFSADEGAASFECRLDAGSWDSCSSPQGYSSLADGNHAFRVRATDAAGNVDPTPATFSWSVDTVAPETAIDDAPNDPSSDASPSFEFSSDESGSTFECRLDGGAWGACTSPEGLSGLADGSHTFRVRAIDPAGNVDGTPATYTWTFDATPPGGGLTDPGQFLRGTVTLTASPSDSGVGIQSVDFQVSPANAHTWSSIDVDSTDPYSAAWDTTALADGAYDLRIVVTDNASNSSSSTVVEDRIVDNTAPTKPVGFQGQGLRENLLALLEACERQLRLGLRIPDLRQRRGRDYGRRLVPLGTDGPLQAHRQANLPGRSRGRRRQRRSSERQAQDRAQARQPEAGRRQESAQAARLQGRQDHLQGFVEGPEGPRHRRDRQGPQAGRLQDRPHPLQGHEGSLADRRGGGDRRGHDRPRSRAGRALLRAPGPPQRLLRPGICGPRKDVEQVRQAIQIGESGGVRILRLGQRRGRRSARRQTARATCSRAAASVPPGRTKLRSGSSRSLTRSQSSSSRST